MGWNNTPPLALLTQSTSYGILKPWDATFHFIPYHTYPIKPNKQDKMTWGIEIFRPTLYNSIIAFVYLSFKQEGSVVRPGESCRGPDAISFVLVNLGWSPSPICDTNGLGKPNRATE